MQEIDVDVLAGAIDEGRDDRFAPHQRQEGADLVDGNVLEAQGPALVHFDLLAGVDQHDDAARREDRRRRETLRGLVEEVAACPGQGQDHGRTVGRYVHGRRAPGRVIAGTLFHLQHQDALTGLQLGGQRSPGDPGADYDHIEISAHLVLAPVDHAVAVAAPIISDALVIGHPGLAHLLNREDP